MRYVHVGQLAIRIYHI